MSKLCGNQRMPGSKFRQLLHEIIVKLIPRRNLTAEETKRLARLEAIADKYPTNTQTCSGAFKNDTQSNQFFALESVELG